MQIMCDNFWISAFFCNISKDKITVVGQQLANKVIHIGTTK